MSAKSLVLIIIFIGILNKIKGNAEEGTLAPEVQLPQGKLRGFKETSTDGKAFYSFLGIPFAQPPVGNLRFEEPVKGGKWNDIYEAIKMPNECLQLELFNLFEGKYVPTGDEDCLYLNVFTPKTRRKIGQCSPSIKALQHEETTASLPVMVFIHGGGFMSGSASLYQPHILLNEDIVLVVIQYRVGVFGFLSTEDSSMPGNMGLKDQTMALKWVQENIRSFGGNPKEVTIFGQSAGGASTHLHLLSPHSKGLFARAIAQSGVALCPWSTGYQHRNFSKTFGDDVGCKLLEGSEAFKKCLKEKDAASLVTATGPFYKWGDIPMITVPRVDGDFLPDEPVTLLKTGRYNKVNFITGVNRDEGIVDAIWVLQTPKVKKYLMDEFDTYAPYPLRIENEPDAVKLSKVILDYYLKGKTLDDNPMDELSQMFGDSTFIIQYDLTSILHAQDPDMVLYLYEFNHRGQRLLTDLFVDESFPKSYVSHMDEMFYLFTGGPLFPLPLEREEDLELARKIIKLWINFAKFGDPTPEGSFEFKWSPATTSNFKHLSITRQPSMENYSRNNTLEFWNTLDIHVNRILSQQDEKVKKEDL